MQDQPPTEGQSSRRAPLLAFMAILAATGYGFSLVNPANNHYGTIVMHEPVVGDPRNKGECMLPAFEASLPVLEGNAEMRAIARIVERASKASGVEGPLLHAMILAESSYDPNARSPVGAVGLMQLMPETARRFGAHDLYDPEQNVHAGARYMKVLLERFDGDKELAIAAYNAGENAVIRAGNKVPPHPETRAFVPKVIGYRRFTARAG